ncbi:MAG: class I SAM-dependent methyltransferase, partial [Acidimicrobiales bacterium]
LTAGLAERADRVLALDASADPLDTARSALPAHVELRQGTVPEDWPGERFDLVVLSEVGYYLGAEDLRLTARLAAGAARDLIAVHWRHPVADYPVSGDDVQRLIGDAAATAGLHHLVSHTEEDLRIDVWSRDGRSVARRTGLITAPEA